MSWFPSRYSQIDRDIRLWWLLGVDGQRLYSRLTSLWSIVEPLGLQQQYSSPPLCSRVDCCSGTFRPCCHLHTRCVCLDCLGTARLLRVLCPMFFITTVSSSTACCYFFHWVAENGGKCPPRDVCSPSINRHALSFHICTRIWKACGNPLIYAQSVVCFARQTSRVSFHVCNVRQCVFLLAWQSCRVSRGAA